MSYELFLCKSLHFIFSLKIMALLRFVWEFWRTAKDLPRPVAGSGTRIVRNR
jgi:hypothetical protein